MSFEENLNYIFDKYIREEADERNSSHSLRKKYTELLHTTEQRNNTLYLKSYLVIEVLNEFITDEGCGGSCNGYTAPLFHFSFPSENVKDAPTENETLTPTSTKKTKHEDRHFSHFNLFALSNCPEGENNSGLDVSSSCQDSGVQEEVQERRDNIEVVASFGLAVVHSLFERGIKSHKGRFVVDSTPATASFAEKKETQTPWTSIVHCSAQEQLLHSLHAFAAKSSVSCFDVLFFKSFIGLLEQFAMTVATRSTSSTIQVDEDVVTVSLLNMINAFLLFLLHIFNILLSAICVKGQKDIKYTSNKGNKNDRDSENSSHSLSIVERFLHAFLRNNGECFRLLLRIESCLTQLQRQDHSYHSGRLSTASSTGVDQLREERWTQSYSRKQIDKSEMETFHTSVSLLFSLYSLFHVIPIPRKPAAHNNATLLYLFSQFHNQILGAMEAQTQCWISTFLGSADGRNSIYSNTNKLSIQSAEMRYLLFYVHYYFYYLHSEFSTATASKQTDYKSLTPMILKRLVPICRKLFYFYAISPANAQLYKSHNDNFYVNNYFIFKTSAYYASVIASPSSRKQHGNSNILPANATTTEIIHSGKGENNNNEDETQVNSEKDEQQREIKRVFNMLFAMEAEIISLIHLITKEAPNYLYDVVKIHIEANSNPNNDYINNISDAVSNNIKEKESKENITYLLFYLKSNASFSLSNSLKYEESQKSFIQMLEIVLYLLQFEQQNENGKNNDLLYALLDDKVCVNTLTRLPNHLHYNTVNGDKSRTDKKNNTLQYLSLQLIECLTMNYIAEVLMPLDNSIPKGYSTAIGNKGNKKRSQRDRNYMLATFFFKSYPSLLRCVVLCATGTEYDMYIRSVLPQLDVKEANDGESETNIHGHHYYYRTGNDDNNSMDEKHCVQLLSSIRHQKVEGTNPDSSDETNKEHMKTNQLKQEMEKDKIKMQEKGAFILHSILNALFASSSFSRYSGHQGEDEESIGNRNPDDASSNGVDSSDSDDEDLLGDLFPIAKLSQDVATAAKEAAGTFQASQINGTHIYSREAHRPSFTERTMHPVLHHNVRSHSRDSTRGGGELDSDYHISHSTLEVTVLNNKLDAGYYDKDTSAAANDTPAGEDHGRRTHSDLSKVNGTSAESERDNVGEEAERLLRRMPIQMLQALLNTSGFLFMFKHHLEALCKVPNSECLPSLDFVQCLLKCLHLLRNYTAENIIGFRSAHQTEVGPAKKLKSDRDKASLHYLNQIFISTIQNSINSLWEPLFHVFNVLCKLQGRYKSEHKGDRGNKKEKSSCMLEAMIATEKETDELFQLCLDIVDGIVSDYHQFYFSYYVTTYAEEISKKNSSHSAASATDSSQEGNGTAGKSNKNESIIRMNELRNIVRDDLSRLFSCILSEESLEKLLIHYPGEQGSEKEFKNRLQTLLGRLSYIHPSSIVSPAFRSKCGNTTAAAVATAATATTTTTGRNVNTNTVSSVPALQLDSEDEDIPCISTRNRMSNPRSSPARQL